jgi:hypothetical protein
MMTRASFELDTARKLDEERQDQVEERHRLKNPEKGRAAARRLAGEQGTAAKASADSMVTP